ncbi:MAG: ABC transporter substrate-binding protein [Patescibacteria group bacterium]
MKLNVSKIFSQAKNIFRKRQKSDNSQVKTPEIVSEQTDLDKKLVFSMAKQRFPNWQQLQYIPKYLTKKEAVVIRVLLLLIIASLGFLVVRFYQRHVIYLPKAGGSYSEALIGQPSYINPILAQNDIDRDIARLVYSGLFRYDKNLKLLPDLAQNYEISEDKKTYTIHLRQDVKWQNGNPLMADDVVYTYETIKEADFNSPYYASFQGVTINRVDDYTVSFGLDEPFSPFLSNLTIGILPAHIWSDVTASNFRLAEYNTKPIGSGPYKFSELVKDQSGTIKSYLLTLNPDYYNQKPYIEKITFKFYPDFESALSSLQNNKVDGISYIPKDYSGSLGKNKDIVNYSLRLPQYTAIFFNQKNPLLKVKEIKQALAYATDRNRILQEALSNEGQIINGPILEGFLGYNPDIKKYDFDKAKAEQILNDAGWKVPEGGGLRQKDGNELKFSLTTVDQPEYLKTADILRENWENIGVGIELKIMNPLRIDKEVIKPRAYEAFLYGEILGADPDPYPFWHSSQSVSGGLNLSNYYNKDADKLLEEARKTDNLDDRAKDYIDFQNIIAEDVPAVFLYSPYYNYGAAKKIKGIKDIPITIPSDRFNGIEDRYIKVKLGWQ